MKAILQRPAFLKCILAFGCATFFLGTLASHGALMASDNAGNTAYNDGWQNGDNGGSGFGAWTFSNTSGDGSQNGAFRSSATGGNQTGSQVSSGGSSWALYANSGQTANATRSFNGGALAVGQQLSLKMDNGWINNGNSVGFSLLNSSGANRFEFYFAGGNGAYTLNQVGIGNLTGPGYTDSGLSVIFSQLAGNNFGLQVQVLGGSTYNYNGVLSASDISQIRFFNYSAGGGDNYNFYFNDLAVVPEPTNVALGIFGAVGGIGGLVRFVRNRKTAQA